MESMEYFPVKIKAKTGFLESAFRSDNKHQISHLSQRRNFGIIKNRGKIWDSLIFSAEENNRHLQAKKSAGRFRAGILILRP